MANPAVSLSEDVRACPLCGGRCCSLPRLDSIGMLSDGRRVPSPLDKISCLACGCVSHRAPPSRDGVRTTFGDAYSLSDVLDGPGKRRGAAYANLILNAVALPAEAHILDVGCGNGALLLGIAAKKFSAVLVGVEAAVRPAAAAAGHHRIAITRAFAEDLATPDRPFDLVCSINVIEHSWDPAAFLRALAGQAAAGGSVAIVCPRADEPNLELLFSDHVHTLTPGSLAGLGRQCGLDLVTVQIAPYALGDFQLCVFEKRAVGRGRTPPAAGSAALAEARVAYLRAWSRLDRDLSKLAGRADACFGAGEAAALLRAYAPETWARIAALRVDEPDSAWDLGIPATRYEPYSGDGPRELLLAVHPARQAVVAARLARDGFLPIAWPDAIRR